MIIEKELKPFVRSGVAVSVELQKIWHVELDLLSKLIEVLDKNNIRYFIGGGTLLGAVRHQGFIPWDDDIDIMMFREDYEKLLSIAPKEFQEPYFFQTAYTDYGYFRGHAQLRRSDTTGMLSYEADKVPFHQGIFIDIFPLDAVPDDSKAAQNQRQRLRNWNRTLNSGVRRSNSREHHPVLHTLRKSAANLIAFFYPYHKQYCKMEEICKEYNDKGQKRVGLLSFDPNNARFQWHKKYFEETVMLPFENLTLCAPKDYHSILKKMYGDYMTMRREPNYHGKTIFDTEIGYREYLSKLSKK